MCWAELEWPSCLQCCACCMQHRWSWVWALNLHQCLWTCLQVCGSKRLGCHADLYTVNRCCTRDESDDHTSEKTCKGSTLALKHRADITRSPKQGYQWPHEKDLCLPKVFVKKSSCTVASWRCSRDRSSKSSLVFVLWNIEQFCNYFIKCCLQWWYSLISVFFCSFLSNFWNSFGFFNSSKFC